jgi:hypothetical protein
MENQSHNTTNQALPAILTKPEDYPKWVDEMESYLDGQGVWNLLSGAIIPKEGFSVETDKKYYNIGLAPGELPEHEPPLGRPQFDGDVPTRRLIDADLPKVVPNDKYEEKNEKCRGLVSGRVNSYYKKQIKMFWTARGHW